MTAIGMDIGGMSAKIGVVRGQTVVEEIRLPTSPELDYGTFLDAVCRAVGPLRDRYGAEKLGISSCGLIDGTRGTIVYSNNIRWENKPIAPDLSARLGLPVKIANDAKCAALAEAVYGAGKDWDRVCMITLGTGVGGCFIRGRRLESGSPYADADGILGHITVERGGRPCTCGRRGCLEAYASATAVMDLYREKTGEACTARDVFLRAAGGEPAAKEVTETFRFYLGEGLISLVNVLRPEVIVLGGGVAGAADQFLPELRAQVNRGIFGGALLPVRIETAVLRNEAGIIGGALL